MGSPCANLMASLLALLLTRIIAFLLWKLVINSKFYMHFNMRRNWLCYVILYWINNVSIALSFVQFPFPKYYMVVGARVWGSYSIVFVHDFS